MFFSRTIRFNNSPETLVEPQLVFKIIKNKKKSTVELGHSDLLSVYKSSSAHIPISRENMNVFCSDLITMVPEWSYFIFMQKIQDGQHGCQ